MYSLSKNAKATRVVNGATAGQGTSNGSSVDMKDFDTVTFYLLVGSVASTGVVTLKAQQSSDDGSADSWADLAGTAVVYADDDDNKIAILEINLPRERYVRPVVVRATADSVIDGVMALQAQAQGEPVTHDASSVVGSEVHVAPAEGTA